MRCWRRTTRRCGVGSGDDVQVRSGKAWFTVPGSVVDEYYLLNEHRASHIRDCFEFAWWK